MAHKMGDTKTNVTTHYLSKMVVQLRLQMGTHLPKQMAIRTPQYFREKPLLLKRDHINIKV